MISKQFWVAKKTDQYFIKGHLYAYILENGKECVIDLTTQFGSGNEPKTIEELEKAFPKPYFKYDEGEENGN